MPALAPWPNWSQLDDWTADGRPDENRFNNCGPESVAACLKYLTGIELPADYIKDCMYGEAYTGYTDVGHLVGFLQRRCEVPCEVHSGNNDTKLQPLVRRTIDARHPMIVLYYFKLEDRKSGHFCPVIAYDENGCTRANVWNRAVEKWDWPTFEKWQKFGIAIVLKRTRAGDLSPSRGIDPLVARLQELRAEAQPFIERGLARRAAAEDRMEPDAAETAS